MIKIKLILLKAKLLFWKKKPKLSDTKKKSMEEKVRKGFK